MIIETEEISVNEVVSTTTTEYYELYSIAVTDILVTVADITVMSVGDNCNTYSVHRNTVTIQNGTTETDFKSRSLVYNDSNLSVPSAKFEYDEDNKIFKVLVRGNPGETRNWFAKGSVNRMKQS